MTSSSSERPPPPDPRRAFRDAIGLFATGVTIVTAKGEGGSVGMTTNAIASLSLDPLLLLACFNRTSQTLLVIQEARRFGVNVLRAEDEELAALFASRRFGPDKFQSAVRRRPAGWSEVHGVPVLDQALAWIACEVRALDTVGDHVIAIGEVLGMRADPEGQPLVWFRGRYTTTAP